MHKQFWAEINSYTRNYGLDEFTIDASWQSLSILEPWQHFTARSKNYLFDETNIKGRLYISPKPGQIANIAEKVIKHIMENKITSKGAISNIYRHGSIVISVTSEKDANSILRFCSRFQNDLLPSLVVPEYQNGIGFAWEKSRQSYTDSIPKYLACYIKEMKQQKTLDTASIENFRLTLENVILKNRVSNPEDGKMVFKNLQILGTEEILMHKSFFSRL